MRENFLKDFMRYFSMILFTCFALVSSAFAQEPIVLRFDQSIEIVGKAGSVRFCAHPANDPESRTVGLMFQESLPERAGMIFDFQRNDVVHMWMRNTILPLDMVFIGADSRIVKIARDTTPFSLEIISSDVPARRVLEINAGISDKYGLQIGDRVAIGATKCALQ